MDGAGQGVRGGAQGGGGVELSRGGPADSVMPQSNLVTFFAHVVLFRPVVPLPAPVVLDLTLYRSAGNFLVAHLFV